MKIYKFSNILALPFAALLLYFISFLLSDTHDLRASWAVIPLIALVLIYLFQPQIDYWWLNKRPVEIDENVLKLIARTNENYRTLSDEWKDEFHKRLLLYVNARSFSAKGMEKDSDVPYDIKFMIAQIPVFLTLKEKDFLLKGIDRIILYKHAFPSPRYRFLHTAETHNEDGVVLFSLEHAEAAFFHPDQFYNVAWHAFAESYIILRGVNFFPETDDLVWTRIEDISGLDKDKIIKTIGYESFDPLVTVITCFFCYRNRFKEVWPEMYARLNTIFV